MDADTGEVRVPRLLGVFAAGRVVNPTTARSQFLGGMTMGLGMALHEESTMDHRFGDYVNDDLAGYHVPACADVGTAIEAYWLDERDPDVNPLGIKGIGEIGIVGVAGRDRQRRLARHRRAGAGPADPAGQGPVPVTARDRTQPDRPPAPRPDDAYQPDPRRWRALIVVLVAGFMVLLDVSIVNVALPSIAHGLGADDSDLQWIVSGYALAFGLVLVAGGRIGDARGRRPTLVLGLALFTLASAACGARPERAPG